MEWNSTWEDPLTSYVKQFDGLIGDKRTRKTFGELVLQKLVTEDNERGGPLLVQLRPPLQTGWR